MLTREQPPQQNMLMRILLQRRSVSSFLHGFSLLFLHTTPHSTFSTFVNGNNRAQFLNSVRNLKSIDTALDFFHRMVSMNPLPCAEDFTLLVGIVAKMGHYTTSISLIKRMYSVGIQRNIYTLSILANSLCRLNHQIAPAFSVLALMFKIGVEPDMVTLNTLINGLCMEGMVSEALKLFSEMMVTKGNVQPDIITYNTLSHGLCNYNRWKEAATLLGNMMRKGIMPDV